ncbi:amidohydrolase family protein [Blastococcus haudaquaticus]|uniref:5-methylthioadenosine/S-adenosylhomocysteine deaminase n=1 Tax=Blastococcus haudaquaticus TaxID=1938745 RepID=A0A286GHN6_9ACTN|nr:amidohydrolase family protein [Blastococcus haudaquaticus]SOD95020.1 5-methylthioadenosine/S-adenosylhomocysteine deaminase [Blastococcus haudaquaticus]
MSHRFTARAVVVGDREGTVVPDAVVDVDDGLITWVGPAADAPPAGDAELVELPGLLMPGMVNTHSHAPMVLFRGQGEGLPLDRWLQEVMWPREARLTGDDVEVAMTAASAEMLRNGVTTSVEMYFHSERIAAAVGTTGARALILATLIPMPSLPPLQEQLADALRLFASAPDDGSVEFGIGPHAAYTVPLPVLREAAQLTREHGRLLHLHVAETATEGAELLATHGLSVPALLAAHDVLGGRVLAAHCVHMDDGDLDLWAEYDVAVAHCPASNAKLASGIARLRAMLDRGIRVGMGTDGPASNDGLDLLADLRLAASFARLSERSATALTAAEAVWLATGGAADAIGRPDLGQLTAGRRADLVHVDTRDLVFEPVGDPADLLAHLVWSGAGRHVRDVWVAGRQVVRDAASTTVDTEALRLDVAQRAARLAAG